MSSPKNSLRGAPRSGSPASSTRAKSHPDAFLIVGIGCSAGGLEALGQFLAHVPARCGMAFVIVQHLAPDHVSALPELLQRQTRMPVVEAQDDMLVAPDHVYVIPPNKDLSLLHDKLYLLDPIEQRGLRLPIDYFLRSLAADRKEQAVGVILSGMGSDGVFGLRAIKDQGGLTLAQEPSTAQADSMPRSAIKAGVADIVAKPEQLPGRIADTLRHPLQTLPPESSDEVINTLDKIIVLLRDHSGSDFSLYKTSTLHRRIERRMAVHQIATIEMYAQFLRENPHEIDLLFKELLIGVTNFFRDPEVWDTLRSKTLPALLARYPEGKALRAWVAACSTGEEAYSLAIVFKEVLELVKPAARYSLQIYATDLDPDAIDTARKGFYPANIATDVSAERLARCFIAEEDGGYRISKEIREKVVFATQNVVSDPPFTKLDILTCRNLLIYFGAALQKKLLPLFYYALNRDGLLVLGSAETVGNFNHLFAPINHKARIYQRLDQALTVNELEFPGKVMTTPTSERTLERPENLGQLTDQLIQQSFAPAAVLVNGEGDILYFSGRTGKYLEPAAGKTNINIHAMARQGLSEALTGVIRRALKAPQQAILINGLKVGTNGGTQIVNLVVQAIDKPEPLRGRVLIVFNDVPPPRPAHVGQERGGGVRQCADAGIAASARSAAGHP